MPTFSLTTFGSYGRNCQPADSPGGHLSRNGRSPMSLEIVHEDNEFWRESRKNNIVRVGLAECVSFCFVKCVWFGWDMR